MRYCLQYTGHYARRQGVAFFADLWYNGCNKKHVPNVGTCFLQFIWKFDASFAAKTPAGAPAGVLVGLARFELTDAGVKVPCLTTWRQPIDKKDRTFGTVLVGCLEGFEPSASRATIWRANQLRHRHHRNAPEGTRTPGPLLRRQLLYPAELRAHAVPAHAGHAA